MLQRDISSPCSVFHVLPSPYYLLAPASSTCFCADLRGLQPSSGCGEERQEEEIPQWIHWPLPAAVGCTDALHPEAVGALWGSKHQIFFTCQKISFWLPLGLCYYRVRFYWGIFLIVWVFPDERKQLVCLWAEQTAEWGELLCFETLSGFVLVLKLLLRTQYHLFFFFFFISPTSFKEPKKIFFLNFISEGSSTSVQFILQKVLLK